MPFDIFKIKNEKDGQPRQSEKKGAKTIDFCLDIKFAGFLVNVFFAAMCRLCLCDGLVPPA